MFEKHDITMYHSSNNNVLMKKRVRIINQIDCKAPDKSRQNANCHGMC